MPARSLCTLLALLALAGVPPSAAQPYPSKPIRIVSPAQPGTPGDFMARQLGEPLAAILGQPIVVENRAGAMNSIGMAYVARAAADGYTIGVFGSPSAVAPSLLARLDYDAERDFVPVRQIGFTANVLIGNARSEHRSLAGLIDAIRSRPGQLNYASGGNGTPAHLAAELFRQRIGADIRHIPYKGGPAGVAAVLAGEVDLMFATAPAAVAHIRSGAVRAIATSAPARIAMLPDVPTMAELGYDLDMRDWQGIVAPAGTPATIVERLNQALSQVLASPAVRQRLLAAGIEPATDSTADGFARLIRSETVRWAAVIRQAGIGRD